MSDSKREQFKKYLETGNVIEVFNRAMLALNELEEPPEDPLAFVRENMGAPPCENVDKLIRENQDLTAKLIRLRQEITLLEGK